MAPLQATHERLAWLEPRSDDRYRLIAWTCDCRAVVYELRSSGGIFFVQRIVQGRPRTITETSRTRAAEAHKLWLAILLGQAR
ncbi:hypothetical protein AB0B56_17680 [Streptosporangium canum]|uniref:hypothetical protein n=1 Tax=Streptosporangium canum TaxID=324952 RepID=UPI00342B31DF